MLLRWLTCLLLVLSLVAANAVSAPAVANASPPAHEQGCPHEQQAPATPESKAALAMCYFHCAPALLPHTAVGAAATEIATVRLASIERALPGAIVDVDTPPPRT
ncbi:MAG: hypothetical protein U1E46_17605 [Hyphomicrobiales bacterium]